MIPSGKCQQRGDLRCKDYFTRIYQDQNSVYQLGRQQLGSLIVLVIPPQPNIAKRTMGVHMLILFIRFWVPLPHWAMVQPMLLLHRTASVSPWAYGGKYSREDMSKSSCLSSASNNAILMGFRCCSAPQNTKLRMSENWL